LSTAVQLTPPQGSPQPNVILSPKGRSVLAERNGKNVITRVSV